jgi:hypothetical protein
MVTYGLGSGAGGTGSFITAFDISLDAAPDVEIDTVGVQVDVDLVDIVVALDPEVDVEVDG